MSKSDRSTTALENGDTRASFLRKAGLGGAALVGGGALLAPGVAFAADDDTIPDVDILNYALTLEYLEATFYTQGLGGGAAAFGVPKVRERLFERPDFAEFRGLINFGPEIRTTVFNRLSEIRNHEVVHVRFLVSALGDAAVRPCEFNFSRALSSVGAFLNAAALLENTGVMAYDGAIRYVDDEDNLQKSAEIATVEARHAAYLNLITGDSPFPEAFDRGKKPSEIFRAASQFIVSCPPEVVALFARLP